MYSYTLGGTCHGYHGCHGGRILVRTRDSGVDRVSLYIGQLVQTRRLTILKRFRAVYVGAAAAAYAATSTAITRVYHLYIARWNGESRMSESPKVAGKAPKTKDQRPKTKGQRPKCKLSCLTSPGPCAVPEVRRCNAHADYRDQIVNVCSLRSCC